MKTLADIGIGLIAPEHVRILILEMFLWTHRIGLKAFGQQRETAESAENSKILAANQGCIRLFSG